MPDSS